MYHTISELWGMINSRNAAIKDLESTLNRSRARAAEEIAELKRKNAVQEQGLRCMSDTISWMTDNRRIF